MRSLPLLVVATLFAASCGAAKHADLTAGPPNSGGDVTAPAGSDSLPVNTGGSTPDTLVDTSILIAGGDPGDTAPVDTGGGPVDTLADSTTTVAGAAVAGNSGGEGEGSTDSHSEVVRESDGSCHGWAGRDNAGPWTTGLEAGAAVTFLAKGDDTVIGSGTLGTGQGVSVGPDGNQQWMCTFPFSGEISGNPASFRIKVGELAPWLARPDPTNPGSFVASVSTDATAAEFSECTDPQYGERVFDFQVVGQYWSNGIPSVCFAGLDVAKISRPCRPPNIASDHIAAVVSFDDPTVVYEDENGFRADVVATLAPGTKATVVVVTGMPCG